jgi:hypothetical protein
LVLNGLPPDAVSLSSGLTCFKSRGARVRSITFSYWARKD